MNNAEIKEYYAFMRLSDSDFDTARRSINSLKRVRHPDSVSAIIRDALISYARPFTGNRGAIKKKNLRLLESFGGTSYLRLSSPFCYQNGRSKNKGGW
jgi:hypothetical protein